MTVNAVHIHNGAGKGRQERAQIARSREIDALIVAHRPLVRSVARRYVRPGLSLEDLEAEGFLGLIEASGRFDRERGTSFGSYAAWWVRVYVQRFALANRRIVGTPHTRAVRRIQQIRRVQRDLEQASGAEVGSHEVARAMGLRPEQIEEATHALGRRDIPTKGQREEGEFFEPPDPGPTPEEEVEYSESNRTHHSMANRALAVLDPRERAIISRRLLSDDRATLADLGRQLGVTRERVRQLEARALRKMRAALDVAC